MKTITATEFKAMLVSGANNLTNHHHEIDALNVFPVPDGDTGTNMNLTFSAGVAELLKAHNGHVGELSKILSKGLLMGARGNSGVILSQIFRGFYQSVETKAELSSLDLASAFVKGTEIAYKAVMRPVEGTILTVLRESADATFDYITTYPDKNIIEVMDYLIQSAHQSLIRTPELLPVLKEVGVVDSGGAGYVKILEGFKLGLLGTPVERLENIEEVSGVQAEFENDEFGYCTEFIIRLNENTQSMFSEEKFRDQLAHLGDSLVVVQDEEIVKVHVHTLTPGEALNLGQRYGEFVKLKIENMQEQHEHLMLVETAKPEANIEHKKYALIAVAAGVGIVDTFKSYRCDAIISGGQTMNPSTEDFVAAIQQISADHIIVLPNNSNIILAAQQAQSILEDKDITVLNTKTIPQGLSACIMFNPEVSLEENISEMNSAISKTKSASVTYAVKDTSFEGIDIKAGDYMGILEKSIVVSTKDKLEAVQTLLDKAITDEDGLVTLIVGEDVDSSESDAVVAYIENHHSHCELELISGQQPVYSYIIGIE